jgi:hypothetical protein
VKVDLGELGDHQIEAVGLLHLLDFFFDLEIFEDLAYVLREAVDVVGQMPPYVVRVALERLEIEGAVVVKSQGLAILALSAAVKKIYEETYTIVCNSYSSFLILLS